MTKIVPKAKIPIVYCPNTEVCGKPQPDEGKGKTCIYCSCSPLPSYSYPKTSSFYPKPRKEIPKLTSLIHAARKAARAK